MTRILNYAISSVRLCMRSNTVAAKQSGDNICRDVIKPWFMVWACVPRHRRCPTCICDARVQLFMVIASHWSQSIGNNFTAIIFRSSKRMHLKPRQSPSKPRRIFYGGVHTYMVWHLHRYFDFELVSQLSFRRNMYMEKCKSFYDHRSSSLLVTSSRAVAILSSTINYCFYEKKTIATTRNPIGWWCYSSKQFPCPWIHMTLQFQQEFIVVFYRLG